MNGACCLWGQTEQDTIKNSLEWSASFLEKYCTDTINLHDVLRCIYNLSIDCSCTTDAATRLNTIATIAKGVITDTLSINNFNESSDDKARSVRKSAHEMGQQMHGETHIPIHGITKYTLQEKLGASFDDTDEVKYAIVHIKGNNKSFLGKYTQECYYDIKNQIDSELKSTSDKNRLLLVFNDRKLVERLEQEKIFQQIRENFSTMTIDILYIDVGINWFNESGGIIAGNTVETNSNADDTQLGYSLYSPPITESGISGSISTSDIVA
jgi:hypothetical protein